jgi:hypothetical protein
MLETRCAYSREELLQISDIVKHSKQLKVLHCDVVSKVRTWNIQKKRKRGKRGGVRHRLNEMRYQYVNPDNLINIDITTDRHIKSTQNNLSLGVVNVRSIRNKDILLKQALVEDKIVYMCSHRNVAEQRQHSVDRGQ